MASASTDLPAVVVDGVSKNFRLPREQVHTLKERALHPFRNPGHDDLLALRDVSFMVRKGEFFGICGRNGSGKSTLLKCLAGIYSTDHGRIWINGRMSTFIELGVGFNLDLPARDNVLINATMLGLSPREARKRFDAVMDFSELHDYAELKLKNYSSGMLVRLAFAVMIQVDAEVMLIDEVLAVGDASFQQKCFEEFENIRARGCTVLLVTHDMPSVQRFCDRAMLLEHGQMIVTGDTDVVGNRYLELNFSEEARAEAAGRDANETSDGVDEETDMRFGDGRAEIVRAWFEDADGRETELLQAPARATIAAEVRFHADVQDPMFTFNVANYANNQLFGGASTFTEPHPGLFRAGETVIYRIGFDNVLHQDRYALTASVQVGHEMLDYRVRLASAMVHNLHDSGSLIELPYTVSIERDISAESLA
ncbi:MAG: ABC transporter ATP-binding protein [Solirubrobacteraceae bacterium]|nr:ABC transporter ATP-binding protein [Solirubrobacteraceae bacterium]